MLITFVLHVLLENMERVMGISQNKQVAFSVHFTLLVKARPNPLATAWQMQVTTYLLLSQMLYAVQQIRTVK